MRIAPWVRGVMVFAVVCVGLTTAVLGLARVTAADGQCVLVSAPNFYRSYMVEARTGRALFDGRPRTLNFDTTPNGASITGQSPDFRLNTVAAYVWQSSQKKRTVLDVQDPVLGAWSPNSQRLSLLQGNTVSGSQVTLRAWTLVDVYQGANQFVNLPATGPIDKFQIALWDDWSPDSSMVYLVTPREEGDYARLYLRHVGQTGFQTIAFPDISDVYQTKWSPDGRYIAVLGKNLSTAETRLAFYSIADGRQSSMLVPQPMVLSQDNAYFYMTWTPDSAAISMLTKPGHPYTLTLYGPDKRTTVVSDRVEEAPFAGAATNQLMYYETTDDQALRLVLRDSASGQTRTVVDQVIARQAFGAVQLVASKQPDGKIAVARVSGDHIDPVLGGIDTLPADWWIALDVQNRWIIAWLGKRAGAEVAHLSVFDAGGSHLRDFEVAPDGYAVDLGGEQFAYVTHDSSTVSAEALDIGTGKRQYLLQKAPITSYLTVDPHWMKIPLQRVDGTEIRVEMFSDTATPPYVLRDIAISRWGLFSPDKRYMLRWSNPNPVAAWMQVDLIDAQGQARMIWQKANGVWVLHAAWTPSGDRFAMIYPENVPFNAPFNNVLRTTVVEIYAANGDLLKRTKINDDFLLTQLQWTNCQ